MQLSWTEKEVLKWCTFTVWTDFIEELCCNVFRVWNPNWIGEVMWTSLCNVILVWSQTDEKPLTENCLKFKMQWLHFVTWGLVSTLANKLSISGSLLCTLIFLNINETKCTLKLNFKLVCQGLLNILKRRILNIIPVSGGGQALYPVSVPICVPRVDTAEITDNRGRGNHRLLRHLGSIIPVISAISRVIRMASNVSSLRTRELRKTTSLSNAWTKIVMVDKMLNLLLLCSRFSGLGVTEADGREIRVETPGCLGSH